MDLADADSVCRVIREVRPKLIVNAGAYTAVDKAESEPELAMKINGVAPGIMAEEAKKLKPRWFTIQRTMCSMEQKLSPIRKKMCQIL